MDAAVGKVVGLLPLAGYANRLEPLPHGGALCLQERVFLQFIDSRTNQKIQLDRHDFLKVGGLSTALLPVDFLVCPSGRRALATSGKNLVVFDLDPVRVQTKLSNFKSVDAVVFER